jgi:hypothetical protein
MSRGSLLGIATGGDPAVTGVYYDVEYDRDLLPAGTTDCSGSPALGAAVTDDESLDDDSTRLDAGQGLPDLPNDILDMTGIRPR